jgi:molybdopterin-guanine dinucleotide biosynthesis protein A
LKLFSINAFVLAGGLSTRMGRDKALLEFHGRPLVLHSLEKLRSLGLTPRIVVGHSNARPDLAAFAPVIADNYQSLGPLGGIEAALSVSDAGLNLFLPVDLPLVPIEFLRWMIERAELTQALATIPRAQGRPQPLCAIYSPALRTTAGNALAAGDGKVMRVVAKAATETGLHIDSFDVETVATSQAWLQSWPAAPPVRLWFENLNTPEDFERAALEQTPSFE